MTAPSIIIIVDKNRGSGNFTSIQGAIDSLPLVNQDRVLIDVHEGINTEKVTIPSTKAYIKIQGAGAEKTVVQWSDTASQYTTAWNIWFSNFWRRCTILCSKKYHIQEYNSNSSRRS
ncbi:hypothetical protein ABFX02_10G104000 [Erythranthe guttata]